MSRTPARFTQADVARTIRAARQAGAGGVEIRPDGSIFVHLSPSKDHGESPPKTEKELELYRGAVL
jgi:hypothetical protein